MCGLNKFIRPVMRVCVGVCQVRVCISGERCRSLTLLKPAFAELYNRGNTAKVFVPHVAQCNRLLHSVPPLFLTTRP